MQTDWQSFLIKRGAELENGLIAHYGNPERELAVALTGNIICDLSHYALLAIGGDDATAFLHSQLINDIQNLDDNHSQLNGYCNPKGRLIANFRIFKRDGKYYLRYPMELTETLTRRLSIFVMRSKVTIDDGSDHFVRIGYSGPSADKELAEVIDNIPSEVNQVTHQDNLMIIRIPGITPSYEIYGDESSIQDIWTRLDVHSAPIGASGWQLIEVLAGMPHITEMTSEQLVPQMINYQAIDGLSFKKGCYPGQEIVARMHYLGKLKKRMYLARIKSDEAPRSFEEVYSSKKETGARTGNIINMAAHPDGGYAVLAVIQINDAESTEIRLGGASGPALLLQELPYTVNLEK